MDLASAQVIGAGLAAIGVGAAAAGVGSVFGNFLQGALRLPAAAAPHLCEFSADSYWTGETHRLCDRPELGVRLIEEISIAYPKKKCSIYKMISCALSAF